MVWTGHCDLVNMMLMIPNQFNVLIYKYLHRAKFQSFELDKGAPSVRRVLAAVTDRPLMGTARPFHISHDMTSER